MIDTQANHSRRLTGVGATDIEWAPHALELSIASHGSRVYSTAKGKTRSVDNTSGVVAFAISPDGDSLAAEHDSDKYSNGPSGLLMMRADGSNQRTLIANYRVSHGIGPVWSPDGNRVAIQRLCDTLDRRIRKERNRPRGTRSRRRHGHRPGSRNVRRHDGDRATEDDSARRLEGVGPVLCRWSPDSTMLQYVPWSSSGHGVLAVPVDTAQPPVILEPHPASLDELDTECNIIDGFWWGLPKRSIQFG